MTLLARHKVAVAVMTCALAGAGLMTGTGSAHAARVVDGTFVMTGDEGDYIAGSGTYSYDTAAGDGLTVSGDEAQRGIGVGISGKNGDWWSLNLQAPEGKKLAVGTFTG